MRFVDDQIVAPTCGAAMETTWTNRGAGMAWPRACVVRERREIGCARSGAKIRSTSVMPFGRIAMRGTASSRLRSLGRRNRSTSVMPFGRIAEAVQRVMMVVGAI